jgi:arylsulfatase A-like enzyme
MNRQQFLKAIGIGGCGLLLAVSHQGRAAEPGKRPNVIIILADDLGCGDMSLYNGWIKTPRIDRMAREGVRFTDFHSNSSVCSPTRAAFLTGRYQQRVGIIDVIASHLDTPGLEATEPTIPRLMKQNGYKTALFGKWHLGDEPRHNPIHHGFDEFVGFLPGGGDYHKHGEPKLGTAMRDRHWKMLTKVDVVELYDLSKDIKETTNIADKYPQRAETMKAAIEKWKLEVTPGTASRR